MKNKHIQKGKEANVKNKIKTKEKEKKKEK